jgi:uncharacterized membrane protein
MKLAADALVALVALLHVWFLVLEMFLWDKPLGLKTFRHSAAEAAASKVLAANQGLYNGFLAAGLAWGLSLGAAERASRSSSSAASSSRASTARRRSARRSCSSRRCRRRWRSLLVLAAY